MYHIANNNPVVYNNFILSDHAAQALSATYLIGQCAYKPMHIVKQTIPLIGEEVYHLQWTIAPRKVNRGEHVVTHCCSNPSAPDIIVEPSTGLTEVPFLHIYVHPRRGTYEHEPRVYYSNIFHGRGKDHESGDPMSPESIILITLRGASASRLLYTGHLWTDDPRLGNHPWVIVNPGREGSYEVKHRVQV